MPGRYERPAALPPSVADLYHLLIDVHPTIRQIAGDADATERRRIEAVNAVLTVVRSEPTVQRVLHEMLIAARPCRTTDAYCDLMSAGPAHQMEGVADALFSFIFFAALRILLAADPVEALTQFVGKRRRARGRPRTDEHRDLMIATDVAELVDGGMPIDTACAEIARRVRTLHSDRVEQIYKDRRGTDEVNAYLELRLLFRPAPTAQSG